MPENVQYQERAPERERAVLFQGPFSFEIRDVFSGYGGRGTQRLENARCRVKKTDHTVPKKMERISDRSGRQPKVFKNRTFVIKKAGTRPGLKAKLVSDYAAVSAVSAWIFSPPFCQRLVAMNQLHRQIAPSVAPGAAAPMPARPKSNV